MDPTNPLTEQFLERHPARAARTLERLSAKSVGEFLGLINPKPALGALAHMMPDAAARTLAHIPSALLERLAETQPEHLARLSRNLPAERAAEILEKLSKKAKTSVQRQMIYPAMSVGAHAKSDCPVLPASLTAGEVLKRLEKRNGTGACLIYVIDDANRFVGTMEPGSLLGLERQTRLQSAMNRRTPALNANALVEDVVNHRGWRNYRQLPVVEKNNIYLGYIDYETVEKEARPAALRAAGQNPFDGFVSLIGLYWLSVAWVLEIFLAPRKDREQD